MKNSYFHEYFEEWIELYKVGAVREVTLQKYYMTLKRLVELAPDLKIGELDKRSYQNILNKYAETHERVTTMDFHHQLKGVILDAVDEGLLVTDPTRKIVIKGKSPKEKKPKFLNQFELKSLLKSLDLTDTPNWDWFILLTAKTGLRFAEALALTPNDFDFEQHKVKITKTWNYKSAEGGFRETKNLSSKRTVRIDPELNTQFSGLVKNLEEDKPIFVQGRVFNSTINSRLKTLCKIAGIPVISTHSLRHTHASVLIFAGVSVASVAGRLGHASIATTQETYLHIIKELESQDNEKVIQHLLALTA